MQDFYLVNDLNTSFNTNCTLIAQNKLIWESNKQTVFMCLDTRVLIEVLQAGFQPAGLTWNFEQLSVIWAAEIVDSVADSVVSCAQVGKMEGRHRKQDFDRLEENERQRGGFKTYLIPKCVEVWESNYASSVMLLCYADSMKRRRYSVSHFHQINPVCIVFLFFKSLSCFFHFHYILLYITLFSSLHVSSRSTSGVFWWQ